MTGSNVFLLRILGPRLVSARFSQHVILTAEPDNLWVDIEGEVEDVAGGVTKRYQGTDPVDGQLLATRLDGQTLKELFVMSDGTLIIEFEPDGVLRVFPDAAFESWQVRKGGQPPWVGLPGGGVG
jgi:hypothetical protein